MMPPSETEERTPQERRATSVTSRTPVPPQQRLINEGFGYRMHNSVFSMVSFWPPAMLGVTAYQFFCGVRKAVDRRCSFGRSNCFAGLLFRGRTEERGRELSGMGWSAGAGEGVKSRSGAGVCHLYVPVEDRTPDAGPDELRTPHVKPIACPLYCAREEQGERTSSQPRPTSSCDCISCRLREADYISADLDHRDEDILDADSRDTTSSSINDLYADGVLAPRPDHAGSWHELFVGWIKTTIRLFWLNPNSALSLWIIRFWTDFSIAGNPAMRGLMMPHIVKGCFRTVRKTDVQGLPSSRRGDWSYVLWHGEKTKHFRERFDAGLGAGHHGSRSEESAGWCSSRRMRSCFRGDDPQMLDWEAFVGRGWSSTTSSADREPSPSIDGLGTCGGVDGSPLVDPTEDDTRSSSSASGVSDESTITTSISAPSEEPENFLGLDTNGARRRVSGNRVVVEMLSGNRDDAPLDALRRAERVVFYTHGGAFLCCDADMALAILMYDLVQKADCFLYACNYRRCPEFDVAKSIEDVTQEYNYLLSLGVDPKRIVVVGESAGASLTLQLLVKLREEATKLPGGAALLSPWSDLSDRGLRADSMISNARRDMVSSNLLRMLAHNVARPYSREDPRVSVVYHFEDGGPHACGGRGAVCGGGRETEKQRRGDSRQKDGTGAAKLGNKPSNHSLLPPILIHAGQREVLRDTAVRLAQVLEPHCEKLQLEVHNIVHAGHLFGRIHGPSGVAVDRLVSFIKETTAAAADTAAG